MAANGRTLSRDRTLRVAGAQTRNVVGDLDGNAEQILAAMSEAEKAGADVVVFPELALTGYPLADLVLRKEFVDAAADTLEELARCSGLTASVVGTIARVPPRRSWDIRDRDVAISAAVLFDGQVRGLYHKVMLPNYEVFEEARNFAQGSRPDALWRVGESIAGIAICEDLWSGDGPPEAQSAAGAEILLVPNASPFNQEKPSGRRALVTEVARRNATPVVYVNCVGGQDELVFDGGSLVVDADGELLYRSPQFESECFCLDVPLGPPRPMLGKPTTVHARPRAPRSQLPAPPLAPEVAADAQVWHCLVLGTRDFLLKNGRSSAVLGLSGGIDAAVTAAVAADALGPENVLGVAMPAPGSPDDELHDSEVLAAGLGIEYHVIPLEGITAAVRGGLAELLEGWPDERPTEGLALLRGLHPVASGAPPVCGHTDDDFRTADRARPVVVLGRVVVVAHRQITRIGGKVARQRREIAGVRDRVTLTGGVQPRLGALSALTGRALAHLTTDLVRTRVDAGRPIAVAGSLVAVGSRLVTVGAGLVAVRRRLIDVGERLIAVGQRLLIDAGRARDALLQRFLDRSVRHTDGTSA